ncbi:MAG: peptidoglycan editing factor PgeF [Anaerolineae bacterium]
MTENGIGLFRFATFDAIDGLVHGVSQRHGGVSQSPWASLNLGGSVGDQPEAVHENHNRLCAALDIPRSSLVSSRLVHGDQVAVVAPHQRGTLVPQTDALLSADPDVYLLIRCADCVPVIVVDPVRRVVGAAHAGWRGTLAFIAQKMVRTMVDVFDSQPSDLRLGIGPSIGPCCYEVREDVIEATHRVFGDGAASLLHTRQGRTTLDLWEANRLQVAALGVQHIAVSGVCTACHVRDYYSHRAEAGRTGRFAAVIGFRDASGASACSDPAPPATRMP